MRHRSSSHPALVPPSSRLPSHGPIAALIVVLSALPSLAWGSDSNPYAAYLEEACPTDGPGATAIVVRAGEVLYRGARGMADLELGVPLVPEHVFRLGSITKQFTAVAIMLLAEQGRLSVDDEITKFLPDYPTHGYRITVEHLLTHTSGVSSYTGISGYMLGAEIRADLSTEELVDVFDDLEMDFAPGQRWSYSNSGYVLLGAIIEEVSGLSYADFVQRHIFDPLGMANSHYGGPQLVPRRVEGYTGTDGNYSNAPFLSMTQPHAAGSLLSSVDDLARWNAAVFDSELLKPETVERMTRKAVLTHGEEVEYGYGYQLSSFRGESMIYHGGGIHGFVTNELWLPESKIFVAVLSNSPENPIGPAYVARQMAAKAIGRPFPKRTAITLDADTLEDFVGAYRIDDETTRTVTLDGGRLYSQRSGGPRLEIHAHADDAFFYEHSFTHLTFDRSADGQVTAMHLYPNGADKAEVSDRISDPTGPAERETAAVSPELYDLWAGTYEIHPGFELEIRRDGDRLISQATAQPAFELHPATAHRYFVKEFAAEIEFEPGDDGRARALVLYQGGQEIRAERTD